MLELTDLSETATPQINTSISLVQGSKCSLCLHRTAFRLQASDLDEAETYFRNRVVASVSSSHGGSNISVLVIVVFAL